MFYIFVLLSKFCKNYRENKFKTRIKSYDGSLSLELIMDLFLHTCSDCDVSFQAVLHYIDFTDIDDLWSVICFSNVKTSVHFQFRWFVICNARVLENWRHNHYMCSKIGQSKFLRQISIVKFYPSFRFFFSR